MLSEWFNGNSEGGWCGDSRSKDRTMVKLTRIRAVLLWLWAMSVVLSAASCSDDTTAAAAGNSGGGGVEKCLTTATGGGAVSIDCYAKIDLRRVTTNQALTGATGEKTEVQAGLVALNSVMDVDFRIGNTANPASAAGLRIDVLPETDGLLNFRTLNAGAKRGPPTDTGLVVLPPLGVWTDVGWCPGFRTDVCIFRADLGVSVGVPVIEAAFFTFAGTLAGFCPAEEIVIHPPMFKLRARNNSAAAPTSIIAVWR